MTISKKYLRRFAWIESSLFLLVKKGSKLFKLKYLRIGFLILHSIEKEKESIYKKNKKLY
jgi:hypothetical protein